MNIIITKTENVCHLKAPVSIKIPRVKQPRLIAFITLSVLFVGFTYDDTQIRETTQAKRMNIMIYPKAN
ncbi:hypothetical protein AVV44_gp151 [Cronobacter phage S13]|uniref:hypothetical protein n=1 Tax=Cronobacter phage S13 TaxID=1327935 RepID=UPI00049AAD8C|nr:hypothetical protein AVV44_gp151 [Cronobacter phage S13]AIA64950.1 hypothetical protein S13_151 [Cronobacter phage S13]